MSQWGPPGNPPVLCHVCQNPVRASDWGRHIDGTPICEERRTGMSNRYIGEFTLGSLRVCHDCGSVVHDTEQHTAWHRVIDLMYDAIPARMPVGIPGWTMGSKPMGGEEPVAEFRDDPLVCAVCGEPVHRKSGNSWRCDKCRMWRDAVPAATLTPPVSESLSHQDTEPPVGSVVRCSGCGNVFVHKSDGWVNTDDGSRGLAWAGLSRPSCGPLTVVYRPGDGP